MSEQGIWKNWREIREITSDPMSVERIDFYNEHRAGIKSHVGDRDKRNPQLAIIIPAYNEQEYIPRALAGINESLMRIDPNEIRALVFVVDNRSSDETRTIAEGFGALVVRENMKGIGNARQTGLESLPPSVEYVLVTDADSLVASQFVKRHLRELTLDKVVTTWGAVRYLPDKHDPRTEIILFSYSGIAKTAHRILNLTGTLTAIGQNQGYVKEAANEVGGYRRDLQRGADTMLMIKLSQLGEIHFLGGNEVFSSGRRIIYDGAINHGRWRLGNDLRHLLYNKLPVATEYSTVR